MPGPRTIPFDYPAPGAGLPPPLPGDGLPWLDALRAEARRLQRRRAAWHPHGGLEIHQSRPPRRARIPAPGRSGATRRCRARRGRLRRRGGTVPGLRQRQARAAPPVQGRPARGPARDRAGREPGPRSGAGGGADRRGRAPKRRCERRPAGRLQRGLCGRRLHRRDGAWGGGGRAAAAPLRGPARRRAARLASARHGAPRRRQPAHAGRMSRGAGGGGGEGGDLVQPAHGYPGRRRGGAQPRQAADRKREPPITLR